MAQYRGRDQSYIVKTFRNDSARYNGKISDPSSSLRSGFEQTLTLGLVSMGRNPSVRYVQEFCQTSRFMEKYGQDSNESE